MLQLIISMTLWGTLGIFVLWSGLSAIDIAFYRCLIAALVIGCWLLKSKEKIKLDKSTGIVALAGIFLVLNWVFLFKSFQISSITIGNMSYYLQPIMLIILGIFFYNEKVSPQKWMLILFALSGVLLTIDLHNLNSPNILLGVCFALIAALLYSFLTILMKNVSLNYFKVIFIQLAIGVIILLPLVHFRSLSLSTISCLIMIGVVHTLLAYFLYYNAIKKTTFTQIAVLSYLDPIVAIITDILFFNRQLNMLQIAGVALTFCALYLLVTAGRSISSTSVVESI
ncbi:MAG: DMT family transporter [Gammaproteobacteria bacterium]